MRKLISVATFFLLTIGTVTAQPAQVFFGTWKLNWEGDARPQEARLVITEVGGTWKTDARQKNNPCVGREVPVRIDAATQAELTVTLLFAEVISGCKNSEVSLKVGPGNVVTGRRGKAELTLSKE